MTDKVADDNYDDDYDDYKVIPWIASSKSSDQKEKRDSYAKIVILAYRKHFVVISKTSIFWV